MVEDRKKTNAMISFLHNQANNIFHSVKKEYSFSIYINWTPNSLICNQLNIEDTINFCVNQSLFSCYLLLHYIQFVGLQ